jgi:hypothetical protein
LLPVAVVFVTRLGSDVRLVGDLGAIDVRARDVVHGHPALVGVYSRFGWQHPGPFLFYWLAPFMVLSSGNPWGAAIGGTLLQAAAVVAVARITWKTNDVLWLLAGMVSMLFALVALGDDGITVPWNPYIAAAWFMTVVWLTWAIVEGRTGLAGWWLVAASIVVQSHVGFVLVVALCGVWVGVRLVIAVRRHEWERPSKVGLMLAALMWVPVAIDQLTDTGNLHSIARWVARSTDPTVGLRPAMGMVAASFRPLPDWLVGRAHVDAFSGDVSRASGLILLVALAVAMLVGLRSSETAVRRLSLLAVSLTLASTVAVSRISGGAFPYVMFYVPATAVLLVVAAVVGLGRSRRSLRRPAAVILAVGLVWSSAVLVRNAADRTTPNDLFGHDADALLAQLPEPEGRLLLRTTGANFGAVHGALVDEYDRRGVDVRVDPVLGPAFDRRHVAEPDDVDRVWYVSESGTDTRALLDEPGSKLLASTSPLSADQEAQLVRDQEQLRRQLAAAGRVDLVRALSHPAVELSLAGVPGVEHDTVKRVAELNQLIERSGRCECAVIEASR